MEDAKAVVQAAAQFPAAPNGDGRLSGLQLRVSMSGWKPS